MSRIPRIRRWLSVPAGLAQNCWQPWPPPSSADWAEGSPSADTCSAAGRLSFRRIVDIPFDACLAALESWQRTGQDSELHVGQSFLRGPIERDRDSGACSIQVRLARGPLRPPLLTQSRNPGQHGQQGRQRLWPSESRTEPLFERMENCGEEERENDGEDNHADLVADPDQDVYAGGDDRQPQAPGSGDSDWPGTVSIGSRRVSGSLDATGAGGHSGMLTGGGARRA